MHMVQLALVGALAAVLVGWQLLQGPGLPPEISPLKVTGLPLLPLHCHRPTHHPLCACPPARPDVLRPAEAACFTPQPYAVGQLLLGRLYINVA